MSDMLRRTRPERIDELRIVPAMSARLPQEDVRELFDEALEAYCEAVGLVHVAVVGNDGGNRRKQPDRRCDERLGDAWCHMRKRGLLDVGQAAKRIHDPPDRAKQAD